MKNFLNTIRSFFASLGAKFKRKPKGESTNLPRAKGKIDRFTVISWGVTMLVVVTLLISTILYKNSLPITITPPPQPTTPTVTPDTGQPQGGAPVVQAVGSGISSILRELQLKTNIPERPRYNSIVYRVSRGDAMLSIADDFKVKSETILYVNKQ